MVWGRIIWVIQGDSRSLEYALWRSSQRTSSGRSQKSAWPQLPSSMLAFLFFFDTFEVQRQARQTKDTGQDHALENSLFSRVGSFWRLPKCNVGAAGRYSVKPSNERMKPGVSM